MKNKNQGPFNYAKITDSEVAELKANYATILKDLIKTRIE